MNRGYVKLWRKSKDSGFLGNADAWQLLCWCLLKASHKPHKVLVGKQLVALEPGQLVFGRISAAKELNTTEKKIRTSLELLKNADFLTTKAASKYSIISIVNWHIYQDEGPAKGQQDGQHTGQQGASKGPAKGHKQECKNINTREEKKESIIAPNPVGFRAENGTLVCDKDLAKERTAKNDTPPRDDLTAYYLPVKSPNMGDVAYLKAENWKTWSDTYGEAFCMACLKAAYAWLLSNPGKAKTVSGIHTFFNSWLKKEQDRPGGSRASPPGRVGFGHYGNGGQDYGQSDFGALGGARGGKST